MTIVDGFYGLQDDPEPITASPPLPGARLIAYDANADPYTLNKVLFEGTAEPVSNPPIELEQSVDLLTGVSDVIINGTLRGSMLVCTGSAALKIDTIQEIAFSDLTNEMGRYQYIPGPGSTNIGGDAIYSITTTTENNSLYYWVELELGSGTHTWNLIRSIPGRLNTHFRTERTFTVDNEEITDLEPVDDLHMVIVTASSHKDTWLFIESGQWRLLVTVRYWNGSIYKTVERYVTFPDASGLNESEIAPGFLGDGFTIVGGVLSPGVIEGNRSATEEKDFPQPGSYNARLLADRTFTSTWAEFNPLVPTASIDNFGGKVMTVVGGNGGVIQRVFRGDPEGADFDTFLICDDPGSVMAPGNFAITRYGMWIDP